MAEKNKEIVAKADAAFADVDIEEFLALCVEDVKWTMVGDRTLTGKDNIREWMMSMNAAPPKISPANTIAEGDFITAYGDMTMTDKTGKVIPYSYCDIYRIRGNKIAELRSFVIKTEAKYKTSGEA